MRSIARGAAPCTERSDAEDGCSDRHPGSAGRTTGQLTLPRIEVRPSGKLALLLDLDIGLLEFLGHRWVSASHGTYGGVRGRGLFSPSFSIVRFYWFGSSVPGIISFARVCLYFYNIICVNHQKMPVSTFRLLLTFFRINDIAV